MFSVVSHFCSPQHSHLYYCIPPPESRLQGSQCPRGLLSSVLRHSLWQNCWVRTMALLRSGSNCKRLLFTLVVAFLLVLSSGFVPVADCRPVPSGWDLTTSEGSSDLTLWRHFSTRNQASRYHRLLRELEVAKKPNQETVSEETKATEMYAEDTFTTMDYANPRSNASGSSDDYTPPLP